jgi:hypothetical protein
MELLLKQLLKTKEQFTLTNSMKKSLSWDAGSYSASQEIPDLLRNPEINYQVYKS